MSPTVIITTIVLGAVALVVAAITMYVQNKTQEKIDRVGQGGGQPQQGGPAAPAGEGDADPLIREASARLAQSKAGAGVANLPMVFGVGDRGTAKNSNILDSGLEPE